MLARNPKLLISFHQLIYHSIHLPQRTTTMPELDIPLHVAYIQNLDQVRSPYLILFKPFTDKSQRKDLGYHLTEHLRLNGVYWGLTALFIMGREDALDRVDMIDHVLSCWDDEAGKLNEGEIGATGT